MQKLLKFNKVTEPEKILIDCLHPYIRRQNPSDKDLDSLIWPKALKKVRFQPPDLDLTFAYQESFVLLQIVLCQSQILLLGANIQDAASALALGPSDQSILDTLEKRSAKEKQKSLHAISKYLKTMQLDCEMLKMDSVDLSALDVDLNYVSPDTLFKRKVVDFMIQPFGKKLN
jgi:hypothetical protein